MAAFEKINPYARVGQGKTSGVRRDNVKSYGLGSPGGTMGGYKRSVGQAHGKGGYSISGDFSPATSEAIRPMPRTASMAVKVRKPLALSKTTPPVPRGTVAKSASKPAAKPAAKSIASKSPSGGIASRVKATLKNNSLVNQAKAKARMVKASRK